MRCEKLDKLSALYVFLITVLQFYFTVIYRPLKICIYVLINVFTLYDQLFTDGIFLILNILKQSLFRTYPFS